MMLPTNGSIMSSNALPLHPVARRRTALGWTQGDLARHAGIPRTTVSAIEGSRLTPSVTAALALARALDASVEEIFAAPHPNPPAADPTSPWAWKPRREPARYWEADLRGRRLLFPVESTLLNPAAHDGLWEDGIGHDSQTGLAGSTLVLAGCDPAAGVLASEYARSSGLRLIVVPRSGAEAIQLLRDGLIHVAAIHRSTTDQPQRNAETVRAELGDGYQLLRAVDWEEGLALAPDSRARSATAAVRGVRRWALRTSGSAARECLDELLGRDTAKGRTVDGHSAVAEAVHAGWAEAGICVRLSAEEAGLHFLPIRTESLDFCFRSNDQQDPRILALIRLLRDRSYRRLVSELPGYDARNTGELFSA